MKMPGAVMKTIKLRHLVLASAACLCSGAMAHASSLNGPLALADFGSFFVNGRNHASEFADARAGKPVRGTVRSGQMYVQYLVPSNSLALPIVMVHGANHTGVTYETTPDGREGWATYFARQGYPVYIADQAGRGRSGFDPTPINKAVVEGGRDALPSIAIATRENAWMSYRLGPKVGEFWQDSRFPQAALDHYFSQNAPMAETTLPGGGENTIKGLVALLEKIGPSILLVHSQSGAYGLAVAKSRPELVKALVSVEGDCVPMTSDDVSKTFMKVPLLSVWGDHSFGFPSRNGDERRNGCSDSVKLIQKAGGPATFFLLPEHGIKGNSHMMMLETNNTEIADTIIKWIKTSVKN